MSDKALPVLGSIVHFHVEGAHGTASEPKLGRCVEVSFDRYLVKTTEGLLADVPSCNVALYRHVAPEHGGFDVVWPDAVETVEIFAELVVKCVQLKGYCVIQMFGSEDDRYNAKAMALNMPGFGRLHPEFEESYLGRELETKLTWVDSGDGFEKYIDDLISLGGLLMPIVEEHLGFSPSPERLSTMLRVPFEGKAEKEELRPLVLSNEDIEGGEVERFLAFVKNRRLCFMSFVDGSGIVALHPKTEMSLDPVTLPVGANRMLIFRHDLMGYSYFPGKDDIVLQAWLLEERQVIELNEITGTPTKVDLLDCCGVLLAGLLCLRRFCPQLSQSGGLGEEHHEKSRRGYLRPRCRPRHQGMRQHGRSSYIFLGHGSRHGLLRSVPSCQVGYGRLCASSG